MQFLRLKRPLALLALTGCAGNGGAPVRAGYVGRQACTECHAAQANAWTGSRHDLAMQLADSTTVLGDFAGTSFTYAGTTSTFSRKEGGYRVTTDGPDGRLTEYRVAYTFGVYPLQQYLIPFPGGRYQALNVVWDTRPKSEGGQRWFHLYPDERVDFRDPLHWTGPLQNWNSSCAECHSTNLQKGYSAAADSYNTTWSEIDVSCEACHGPGAEHVKLAHKQAGASALWRGPSGLAVALKPVPADAWVMDSGRTIARRAVPPTSNLEAETCARCHARRSAAWAEYEHGKLLEQTHRMVVLEQNLYHADGQQLDEVYEYGSFLQSLMASAGVTCSDCHDPHSGGVRAEGNAVCARCHLPSNYDAPSHHFHRQGSEPAQCVSCHMPARNYMVVDARRDHSFRIPRPDLSVRLGTPDACSSCHKDRPVSWSAAAAVRWYGLPDSTDPLARAAVVIHAGREGLPGAGPELVRLAADATVSGIARATAVSLMPRNPGPTTLGALTTALADADPLVRRSAAEALEEVEPAMRLRMGFVALTDSVRSVRLAAAATLSSVPQNQWTPEQRQTFDRAVVEYRQAQLANADRAEAHANLGRLEGSLGRLAEAEAEFRTALRIWPRFVPAWVQLAEVLRGSNREPAADSVLRAAQETNPANPDLHYALGLSLIRRRQMPPALEQFARAAALAPEVPRYAYVYAIALHDSGAPARAMAVLAEANRRHPNDVEILQAIVSYGTVSGVPNAAASAAATRLLEFQRQR